MPGQFRQKKTSRREALDFYRTKYDAGDVQKLTEAPATTAQSVGPLLFLLLPFCLFSLSEFVSPSQSYYYSPQCSVLQ